MQSLPHHTQRANPSMVQQDSSRFHLNLQGIKWALRHTFHWGSVIQEVLSKPFKSQTARRQEPEVVCHSVQLGGTNDQ